MAYLLTSLVALLLGPVLASAFRRRARALAALDGFVIAAIIGLVVLHILPHAVAAGGLAVMVAAVIGLLLPSVLERRLHGRGARSAGRGVIALIACGLAIHAALDGAALALPDEHGDASEIFLAIGVILHRIPVGMAIWGVARPYWGALGAVLLVAVVAVATVAGFGLGERVLGALSGPWLGAFEALVAGTILHVVVGHRLPALSSPVPHRAIAAAGAVVGIATHVLLLDSHAIPDADAGLPAAATFATLALLGAPALLAGLAAVAAGAWLTPGVLRAWRGATRPLARAARDAVIATLGRATPIPGAAVATPRPILGALALLLSIPLLGPEVTLGRMGVALLLLLALTLLRARTGGPDVAPPGGGWQRVVATLDHEAPWLVAGVALAAMLEPVLSYSVFAAIPAPWQAVLAAALAAPWYLSAAGMTPLAAILLHKGAAPGAVIVFLIVGASVALRAPTCRDQAHRRTLRREGALAIAIALPSGWLFDAVVGPGDLIALHHAASLEPATVTIAAATALTLLTLAALFRQGPRGFIAQITGHGDDAHDAHDHGAHGHDAHDTHRHEAHHHDDDHAPLAVAQGGAVDPKGRPRADADAP